MNPWAEYRSTLRRMCEAEVAAGEACGQENGCRQSAGYVYTYYTLDRGGGGSWKTRPICEFHARQVDRRDVIGFAWEG